jgi:hypothetical protein
LRDLGRQAEARPTCGHDAGGSARCRKDITAVDQPLQGLADLLGGKIPLQLANELPNALSAFAYRRRERTVEFAVQKELPVLGIKTHHIWRQNIDGEIGRKLRNGFAVVPREAVPGIVFHEVNTRTFATTGQRCKQNAFGRVEPDPTRP